MDSKIERIGSRMLHLISTTAASSAPGPDQTEEVLEKLLRVTGMFFTKLTNSRVVDDLLCGRREIQFVEVIESYVDLKGYFLRQRWMKGTWSLTRKGGVEPITLSTVEDYDYRLGKLEEALGSRIAQRMLPKQFEESTATLRDQLAKSARLSPILNRPYFPVVVPQLFVSRDAGPGLVLESQITPSLSCAKRKSFTSMFERKRLVLINRLKQTPESRCSDLYTATEKNERGVVGLYFPDVLHGASRQGAFEAMTVLGSLGFVLADSICTGLAICMYPDKLATETRSVGLDCAADWYEPLQKTPWFKFWDVGLWLDLRDPHARSDASPGLLYVGQDVVFP